MESKKILLIHNVIAPTRTQLFNKLNSKFRANGYEFKVVFTAASESHRDWDIDSEISKFDFDYQILNSKILHSKSKEDHNYFHINFDIKVLLYSENPDIVIHAGWAGLSSYISCRWANKNKRHFVLWSGSTEYEESWRRFVTKPFVKWLIRQSNSYWSYGTRASKYLELLGADSSKIYKLYNTVDIDFYMDQANEYKFKKTEVRQELGIKTKYVILYVGRLEKGKGVYEMLDGFAEFQQENTDFSLLIVGSGNEEQSLKNIVKKESIKNVVFSGYIQKSEISKYYAVADILALVSSMEIWGLTINEAMCFGLPILTAYRVGASVDLVQEGKNGYIMKENSSKEFEKGMKFILDKGLIEKNNSLEIIKKYSIDNIIKDLDFDNIK